MICVTVGAGSVLTSVACTGTDTDLLVVTQAEFKANQITVKDAFGTATPDQYAAMASFFGLLLCACAAIWSAKRILILLRNTAES